MLLDKMAVVAHVSLGVGLANGPVTARRAWLPKVRLTNRLTLPLGTIPLMSTSD